MARPQGDGLNRPPPFRSHKGQCPLVGEKPQAVDHGLSEGRPGQMAHLTFGCHSLERLKVAHNSRLA